MYDYNNGLLPTSDNSRLYLAKADQIRTFEAEFGISVNDFLELKTSLSSKQENLIKSQVLLFKKVLENATGKLAGCYSTSKDEDEEKYELTFVSNTDTTGVAKLIQDGAEPIYDNQLVILHKESNEFTKTDGDTHRSRDSYYLGEILVAEQAYYAPERNDTKIRCTLFDETLEDTLYAYQPSLPLEDRNAIVYACFVDEIKKELDEYIENNI